MIIIPNPTQSITEYIDLCENIYIPPVYGCPHCHYSGKLNRHGSYTRGVYINDQCVDITIFRVICPSCHKTHALIPDFLVPYFIYPLAVILKALKETYIDDKTLNTVCDNIKSEFNLSFIQEQNISYFRMRFKRLKSFVLNFFVNFADYYFDMDDDSPKAVMVKIIRYVREKIKFNLDFFEKMKIPFLSKKAFNTLVLEF